MFGRVVEVGDGQYDPRHGVAVLFPAAGRVCVLRPGVGVVIAPNPVGDAALFAGIPGALQNGGADVRPVRRVAFPVFRLDRHGQGSPGRPWPVVVN